MKTVGKYNSVFAAEVAKGLLESEGISACIVNEYTTYVGLTHASDPVELRVADEDYESAVKALAASSNAL